MATKVMPAVSGVNPSVTTSWAYYLNGAVDTLTDTNLNGLTYGYDTAGRMTSVSTAIPGITGSLVTGYNLDLAGNRTQLTWPDGYYVTYDYDSLDRMLDAKESGTATVATFTYDPLSRRKTLAYPHASSAYGYSQAGDLTSLAHTVASGTVPAYTLGYSPAHQLASEASSQASYNYAPATVATDAYGTPNSLNQYKTINGAPANGHDCQGNAQQYSYDCNGNLTGDGTWTFAYDPENRLIAANKTSGGTVAATYAYDSLGRRVEKSGTGVSTTFYLDDGEDEIAEYGSDGLLNWRYVPGNTINEPVAILNATNVNRYYLRDHHGSVIAAVNNAGTQIEGPYTYDSYGNGAPLTGSAYKYVGMRLDIETGLYYDRARYYSSVLGRFMQTDPVGYSADLNLYAYGNSDPVNELDQTGRVAVVAALPMLGEAAPLCAGPQAVGCAVAGVVILAGVGIWACYEYCHFHSDSSPAAITPGGSIGNRTDHSSNHNEQAETPSDKPAEPADGVRIRVDAEGKVHGNLPNAEDVAADDLDESIKNLETSTKNRDAVDKAHAHGSPTGSAKERRQWKQHEQHQERIRREQDIIDQLKQRQKQNQEQEK